MKTWEVHVLCNEYEREKKPVTDLLTAALMLDVCGSNTVAEFCAETFWVDSWTIDRTTCTGHYGANQSTQSVRVAESVARELVALTDPTPEWGGVDKSRRTTTHRLKQRIREMEHDVAVAMAL